MLQLSMLVPAIGATTGPTRSHDLWWIILALVIVAVATPLAYVFNARGRGGKPRVQGPPVDRPPRHA